MSDPISLLRSTDESGRFGRLAVAVGSCLLTGVALGTMLAVRHRTPHDAPRTPEETTARLHEKATMMDQKRTLLRTPTPREWTGLPIRRPTAADIPVLAEQWFTSYNTSAKELGSPPLFDTLDAARTVVSAYVASKVGLVSVDSAGLIVASAFQDEADVANGSVGCGPWTVTWAYTNKGIGRELFAAAVAQSISRGARTLRLLQGPTNVSSYALYVRLGFQVRETLAFFSGSLSDVAVDEVLQQHPSWKLSEWTFEDVPKLNRLWQEGTGLSREKTLMSIAKAARKFKRFILKDGERVLAFTTGFGYMGSSCALSEPALKHLLCAAARIQLTDEATKGIAPMLHVSTRLYPELIRWLFESGARVGRTANLMVLGEWNPIDRKRFVYCPSTELS